MIPVGKDLLIIAAAAGASLILGIVSNSLRRDPLPIRYEPREMRTSAVPGSREPDAADYRTVLQASKDAAVLIVDAREPGFYEEGHIPHAINIPREIVSQPTEHLALPDKARAVIVYCSGEECEDSTVVARRLITRGHPRVSVYHGGWEEWSASGAPVEK